MKVESLGVISGKQYMGLVYGLSAATVEVNWSSLFACVVETCFWETFVKDVHNNVVVGHFLSRCNRQGHNSCQILTRAP